MTLSDAENIATISHSSEQQVIFPKDGRQARPQRRLMSSSVPRRMTRSTLAKQSNGAKNSKTTIQPAGILTQKKKKVKALAVSNSQEVAPDDGERVAPDFGLITPASSMVLDATATATATAMSTDQEDVRQSPSGLISPPPEETLRHASTMKSNTAPQSSPAKPGVKRKRLLTLPAAVDLDHSSRPTALSSEASASSDPHEPEPGSPTVTAAESSSLRRTRPRKVASTHASDQEPEAGPSHLRTSDRALLAARMQASEPSSGQHVTGQTSPEPIKPSSKARSATKSPKQHRSPSHPQADYRPPSKARASTPQTTVPYEYPSETFSNPREIVLDMVSPAPNRRRSRSRSPGHALRNSGGDNADGSDTGKKKKSTPSSASPQKKKKPPKLFIKKELPDVDLSVPPPPGSPSDDPLLLHGRPSVQRSNEDGIVSRPSSALARLSPHAVYDVDDEAADIVGGPQVTSEAETIPARGWFDNSMPIDSPRHAVFDFAGLRTNADSNGLNAESVETHSLTNDTASFHALEDGVSESDSEVQPPPPAIHVSEAGLVQGDYEYTGRWTQEEVPTKQDPPDADTRRKSELFGRPISPYPYPRTRVSNDDDESEGTVPQLSMTDNIAPPTTSVASSHLASELTSLHATALNARSRSKSPQLGLGTGSTSRPAAASSFRLLSPRPLNREANIRSTVSVPNTLATITGMAYGSTHKDDDDDDVVYIPRPRTFQIGNSPVSSSRHLWQDDNKDDLHVLTSNAMSSPCVDLSNRANRMLSPMRMESPLVMRGVTETPASPSRRPWRAVIQRRVSSEEPRMTNLRPMQEPVRPRRPRLSAAEEEELFEEDMVSHALSEPPEDEDADEECRDEADLSGSSLEEGADRVADESTGTGLPMGGHFRQATPDACQDQEDEDGLYVPLLPGQDANSDETSRGYGVEGNTSLQYTVENASDEDDVDPNVVQITAEDPKAAARAAAILKLYDYDCLSHVKKRRRRPHATVDELLRNSRRKDASSSGVYKGRDRRGLMGGVVGDRVVIPGSPSLTVPELLHEAEQQLERESVKGSVSGSVAGDSPEDQWASLSWPTTGPYSTPVPTHRQGLGIRSETPEFDTMEVNREPRDWAKDDWKLLDACFTDARLEAGEQLGLEQGTLSGVDEVTLEDVLYIFFEVMGGREVVEGLGPDWTMDNLLTRAKALQRKQRTGHVAPPTPNVARRSMSPWPPMQVPEYTPIWRPRHLSPTARLRTFPPAAQGFEFKTPKLPASLMAPRYAHLMDEAIAISKGERDGVSSEPRSPSPSLSPPETSANTSEYAYAEPSEPPPTPSIGARMKGLLFSYLPGASKSKQTNQPSQRHAGLPMPPPDVLMRERGPINTPHRDPLPQLPHPKDLVHLNHASPKATLIPTYSRMPRRMVKLRKVIPPPMREVEHPRPRRSSGSSVKDLIMDFEHMDESAADSSGARQAGLRRVQSNGDLRRPVWKP